MVRNLNLKGSIVLEIMQHDSETSTGENIGPQRTCSWKLWVEIFVTAAIIAVVWGLLSLPSVFYFLPRSSGPRVSQQVWA